MSFAYLIPVAAYLVAFAFLQTLTIKALKANRLSPRSTCLVYGMLFATIPLALDLFTDGVSSTNAPVTAVFAVLMGIAGFVGSSLGIRLSRDFASRRRE